MKLKSKKDFAITSPGYVVAKLQEGYWLRVPCEPYIPHLQDQPQNHHRNVARSVVNALLDEGLIELADGDRRTAAGGIMVLTKKGRRV